MTEQNEKAIIERLRYLRPQYMGLIKTKVSIQNRISAIERFFNKERKKLSPEDHHPLDTHRLNVNRQMPEGHRIADTHPRRANGQAPKGLDVRDAQPIFANGGNGAGSDEEGQSTCDTQVWDADLDAAERRVLEPLELALKPLRVPLNLLAKEMGDLAKGLLVWPWVEQIRGMGALNLALVIAAAGDLSRFDTVARLWKWFGLYPGSARKKGEKLPYNPAFKGIAFMVAKPLILLNNGEYRQCYVNRKAYLKEKHPEWKLIKKKGYRRNGGEDRTVAKDAQWKYDQEALRYLAKRILRDLWRAWWDCHQERTPLLDTNQGIADAIIRSEN